QAGATADTQLPVCQLWRIRDRMVSSGPEDAPKVGQLVLQSAQPDTLRLPDGNVDAQMPATDISRIGQMREALLVHHLGKGRSRPLPGLTGEVGPAETGARCSEGCTKLVLSAHHLLQNWCRANGYGCGWTACTTAFSAAASS